MPTLKSRRSGKDLRNHPAVTGERLVSVAIQRDGKTHDGLRSHYELRCSLGDTNHVARRLDDVEGFMTSKHRFVDRDEAREVAIAAGQIGPGWKDAKRSLLSSDIEW